ncbi:MAG: hypothetical protein R2941_23590 [Desulfobacterales bacterium]
MKVNQVLCPQYPGYYTYESGTSVLLEAQPVANPEVGAVIFRVRIIRSRGNDAGYEYYGCF